MLIVVKCMAALKSKLKISFKLNSFSMNLKFDEPIENKGTNILGVKFRKAKFVNRISKILIENLSRTNKY